MVFCGIFPRILRCSSDAANVSIVWVFRDTLRKNTLSSILERIASKLIGRYEARNRFDYWFTIRLVHQSVVHLPVQMFFPGIILNKCILSKLSGT